MRTHIVKMGNSRGVRIPKALIEQAGLDDEVEIAARRDCLIIRPVVQPRAGWDEAFAEMARRGDDRPIDGGRPVRHSFDEEEWEWR